MSTERSVLLARYYSGKEWSGMYRSGLVHRGVAWSTERVVWKGVAWYIEDWPGPEKEWSGTLRSGLVSIVAHYQQMFCFGSDNILS